MVVLKAKAFLALFSFFRIPLSRRVSSIVRLDFLDVHGGYYTATVNIHYMLFPFLQLIHEIFISTSFRALYVYVRASFFG